MQILKWENRRISLWVGLVMLTIGGACTPTSTPTLTTRTPDTRLTPYLTAIPVPTSTPMQPPLVTRVPVLPTPTPFTYTVEEGDTLLGIAAKFGVSLEELRVANPSVDPHFLSIGATILIPTGGGELGAFALPTPVPVTLVFGAPSCYSTADRGVWCSLVVKNEHQQNLENLSALVTLYDESGQRLDGLVALPPINLLQPGQQLPLVAFFALLDGRGNTANAQIQTASMVPLDDTRYLPVSLELQEVVIHEHGQFARVRGDLALAFQDGAESQPTHLVRLALIGYGADGGIVGARRWESKTKLAPGASQTFQASVFSVGPEIVRVDVLAEARP